MIKIKKLPSPFTEREVLKKISNYPRHQDDKRILVIPSMIDFHLWRDRPLLNEFNIHALDYKTRWSENLLNKTAQHIFEQIQQNKSKTLSSQLGFPFDNAPIPSKYMLFEKFTNKEQF